MTDTVSMVGWFAVGASAIGMTLMIGAILAPGFRNGLHALWRALWSALRRIWWWLLVRATWKATCRTGGLSKRRKKRKVDLEGVGVESVERWRDPRLLRVRTTGHSVTLKARTRRGQALDELEAFAPKLAASYSADAYRVFPAKRRPGSTVMFDLVMKDLVRDPATAQMPAPIVETGHALLGRRQNGRPFRLQIIERQTLVVGASGSGKGSFLWGVCCSLAPAVAVDAVRLWGIDLKGGVELAMGEHLFARRGYTPDQALELLHDLAAIVDQRTEQMRGLTRSHKPDPGDPLHVLIIDELASLTAYAPKEVKREAEPLLGAILTKGRAVGVVAVAFVQDPRKEVINSRGLFTQTVALRLRSAEEVSMVLGDGMATFAPAHRILKTAPGTAWIVDEDGSLDRVRADYWPDHLIKRVAGMYPAPGPEGWLRVVQDGQTQEPTVIDGHTPGDVSSLKLASRPKG